LVFQTHERHRYRQCVAVSRRVHAPRDIGRSAINWLFRNVK
jgi:hypothetical protein